MSDFYQSGPRLENQYQNDLLLRSYLKRSLPPDILSRIKPGLVSLGERVRTDIFALGEQAEREVPEHVPYDAWGRRVDEIRVSQAWSELDRISAVEGIVAIAYERKEKEFSRIHQMAKVYLFGPSSAIYTCPLAMSDGAARAIELYGSPDLKSRAFARLTTRDPAKFWTSGQWMTERAGGSDVSGTETVAKKDGDSYRLTGTKWFTSATTSQMAMTLARIEGAPEGSKGLSLFYLELRNEQQELNQIFVHRLKDKLGTRSLPTAELSLQGTKAVLVGGPGDGVKKISSLFNITRVWNSCSALAYMRRGIVLATDYATRRKAFGKLLSDHPLHVETLAALETERHAAFHLVFRIAELLGREETGKASSDEAAVLRLLTPIAKLFTAKQSVACASEVVESFGGAGYVEDTGIPALLRNSQVLSIWEGTTNVLSLDMLRAIEKENAFGPFAQDVRTMLGKVSSPKLKTEVDKVRLALESSEKHINGMKNQDVDTVTAGARDFAFGLARVYSAALLLSHADWVLAQGESGACVTAAERWCAGLKDIYLDYGESRRKGSRELLGWHD